MTLRFLVNPMTIGEIRSLCEYPSDDAVRSALRTPVENREVKVCGKLQSGQNLYATWNVKPELKEHEYELTKAMLPFIAAGADVDRGPAVQRYADGEMHYREITWFWEMDMGNTPLARLIAQLVRRYAGQRNPVLLVCKRQLTIEQLKREVRRLGSILLMTSRPNGLDTVWTDIYGNTTKI